MPAFIAQEKPAMYLALRCQLACPNEFQLRALGIPLRCRDLLSLVLLFVSLGVSGTARAGFLIGTAGGNDNIGSVQV